MTVIHIEGFAVEAHLPNQIHHQQVNKDTLGSAIDHMMEYYKPWGPSKLEQIIFKPKYTLISD